MVDTVDGCDNYGQHRYTISDTGMLCHPIENIVRPVFCQIQEISCAYESFKCLDVQIWQFFLDNDNDDNDRMTTLPLAHSYTWVLISYVIGHCTSLCSAVYIM